MSVQSHLASTASKAILSGTEKASITVSIDTLKSRLSAYFGDDLSQQFQFGSSTRGTILPRSIDPRSDVDYMVVFAEGGSKPQTYIDRLRRFAEAKYSSSEISQSHPTVVLNLNHIKFELVPALKYWLLGYQIPGPASGFTDWISTDPNGFNQTLTEANQNSGSFIKPMVRLVKYWNAQSGYVFDSYSLEKHLAGKQYWFNTTLKDYVFDGFLSLGLDWSAAQWRKDKVNRAHQVVNETKKLEADGYPTLAEAEIKKILPVIT